MNSLALIEAPDHVCSRYRIRAFEPALRRAGVSLQVTALARAPIPRAIQLAGLNRTDLVLLQRKLLPPWQLKLIRRKARHFVFDFDDAVLYRDSYDPRGPHCPRRARRFTATVRLADTVIAGNDFLADCALRAGARAESVRVIPTCVETDRYRLADGPRPKTGLDLAWIGSSSTLQGVEAEKPLWEKVAAGVPNVRLRLIADRGADLGAMPVSAVSWRQETEAAELAAGDVGVALMPDDLWSRGKCGLKVLQYQAAGLPVLANPVGVHHEMVEPGVSGWLPRTPDEWVDAVRTLANDELLRHEMGRAGRASVESGYSVKAWEATFAATLLGDSTVPSPGVRTPAKLGRGPWTSRREPVARRDRAVRLVDRGHGANG